MHLSQNRVSNFMVVVKNIGRILQKLSFMQISLKFSFFKKSNGLLIFFITIFLFFTPSMDADILILKNGKTMVGAYSKEDGKYIYFKDMNSRQQRFVLQDVEKIQIGYTGLPACYRELKNPQKKICNVLFKSFENENLVLIYGSGYTDIMKISTDTLLDLEINFLPTLSLDGTTLPKNVFIKAQNKGTTTIGKISLAMNDFFLLKDLKGIEKKVILKQVRKLSFTFQEVKLAESKDIKSKEKEDKGQVSRHVKNIPYYFLPGVGQLVNKRNGVGATLLTASILCSFGIFYQYQLAINAANIANENKNNPVRVQDERRNFDIANDRQKYFIGGLVLLYTWNLLDLIFLNGPKQNTGVGGQQASIYSPSSINNIPIDFQLTLMNHENTDVKDYAVHINFRETF